MSQLMGFVHVYTGNGKGKTTAAFGLAMRAVGRGKKVCVIQFMKPEHRYGEQISAIKLGIEVYAFGTEKFVNKKNPQKEDFLLAEEGLNTARKKIQSGEYDLVILDEINVALNYKLLDVSDILDILKSNPERTEVVLTGRYAPPEVEEIADLVTEMREIKHYFRSGVLAREGIEF